MKRNGDHVSLLINLIEGKTFAFLRLKRQKGTETAETRRRGYEYSPNKKARQSS